MTRTPDFDEEMDRLQDHMPDWAGRNLDRLRQPEAVWVRVPAGIALTGGGVLGFLPVLGFWMLPIGLALLAYDVRPMRPPLARACGWGGAVSPRLSRPVGAAARTPRHCTRKWRPVLSAMRGYRLRSGRIVTS